ncbi:MAG: Gfo/Idh/MocA family oxidoreductase [Dysgonamonadaceae bacterium]|jgi:predicted dehydrogenase|nr:Gfo/Idh/MocA family oxidoreductase [Dysgonamonadaceae bacterium]MDD3309355.1 Gfo/Idh/MocA family oxidoreductase [Dysgonamonadaceae bacterium]MDD3900551.1 Gfo/Idh/MocA family oxidoreductase [Dysgonamonadaceae bacterium]MDD4399068.1 Gfo/Idh/MocA family oxidoreductase [Dysgonamonadaceae bacterium]
MVNWGFIGCGAVAEKKSGPAFRKANGSDVVAVMRRDSEKAKDFATRHKIGKWYNNAYKLINDPEVTAIYVATPPKFHTEYAIASMKAGKPVYIEKPMAASYKDCLKINKVSEITGVPCFVAYYRRTLPYFLRVKQLIEDGELGEITSVQIRFAIPPLVADLNRDNLPWRLNKKIAGAGYFYDLASHQLDLLDFIFGPIEKVKGYSTNIAGLYDVEDTVSGVFKFQSGVLGSGSWTFVTTKKASIDVIDFIGTKGKLSCSTFKRKSIILETSEGVQKFNEKRPENIQFNLIQNIVDYMNGVGEMPVSTGISAARTNWVMDKILYS